jgi:hypothetical protein
LFGALTVPSIVSAYAIRNRRAEHGQVPLLVAGIAVVALWSCCLGIVVLQLILTVRDSLA